MCVSREGSLFRGDLRDLSGSGGTQNWPGLIESWFGKKKGGGSTYREQCLALRDDEAVVLIP